MSNQPTNNIKNTQSHRPSPARLAKAVSGNSALQLLNDYDPKRPEFNLTNAKTVAIKLKASRDAHQAAEIQFNNTRDALAADEWAMINFMTDAADQVVGQYGSSSNEYASLGYKKKSEYKKTAPGKAKKGE